MKHLVLLFGLGLVVLSGCSSSVTGPDVIVLNQHNYTAVFDAAVAAADADGMKPVLLDRRGGIIATEPAVAGSFGEPWKPKPSTARQGLENTLAMQRRTARFEFTPIETIPVLGMDNDVLIGPNLITPTGQDLTKYEGKLELRVWVYVERQYTQGIQRGTWTLGSESITQVLSAEEPWEQVPGTFWAPANRDVAREKMLLGTIEASFHQ
ncbi:MAG: hypothetical protein HOC27_00410 [Phycisphaerae bacterium]|nr:hypothetical protein [Phycisphaerae bacterium]